MCPNQSRAFKEVSNSPAFTVGKINKIDMDEPLPGAPRHVCTKFRANIRRTDCVGPILKSNLTLNTEYRTRYTLRVKPTNYDAHPCM